MAQSFKPEYDVVLINDSADDQFLFQRAVERTGTPFHIRTFFSGPAFAYVEYLRSEPNRERSTCPRPAFVLCDYDLHPMKGSHLVAAIRAIPSCEDLLIFMFGASEAGEIVTACYAAGADYFLGKPATQERLEGIVRTLYGCACCDPVDFECIKRLPEYRACPEEVVVG